MNVHKFCLVFIFFIFSVRLANAEVVLNEIMFDPLGLDNSREWIEIKNISASPVIISTSTWKLFEGETNHKLSLFRGSLNIPAGDYAIITDSPSKFLVDWPNFSGTIFDSAFSLNQSGETVVLKSSSTTVENSVTYIADKSYKEGNSLQRIGGEWKSLPPTPGTENVEQKKEVILKKESVIKNVSLPIEKIVPNDAFEGSTAPEDLDEDGGLEKIQSAKTAETSFAGKNQTLSKWFFILGGIIFFGVLAVLLPSRKSEEVKNEADEYTIVE
jgi:hypothetical protein